MDQKKVGGKRGENRGNSKANNREILIVVFKEMKNRLSRFPGKYLAFLPRVKPYTSANLVEVFNGVLGFGREFPERMMNFSGPFFPLKSL